jgi:hypothetical protein
MYNKGQLSTPNGLKMPNIPSQGLKQYTKNGIFWFENIPSGNPGEEEEVEKKFSSIWRDPV